METDKVRSVVKRICGNDVKLYVYTFILNINEFI